MTIDGKKRSMRRVKKAAVIGAVIAAMACFNQAHETQAQQEMGLNEMQGKYEQVQKQLDNANAQLARLEEANSVLLQEKKELQYKLESMRREVSRGYSRALDVEVTAYDLSESSCDKGVSHPAYGLTANGTNLAGHTLESARAIAVDPDIIPLGSKVRLIFKDEDMQQYNGVYTACDTGGAINGNRIDLFAGEGAHELAMRIGRRQAVAQVL